MENAQVGPQRVAADRWDLECLEEPERWWSRQPAEVGVPGEARRWVHGGVLDHRTRRQPACEVVERVVHDRAECTGDRDEILLGAAELGYGDHAASDDEVAAVFAKWA